MVSSAGSSRSESISLEQLIALNDEIISLVRAGVPLELGLRQWGEDVSGTLGRVSSTLAGRMSRGQSLSDALAAERHTFPDVYRTVVDAGLRAGRLTAALEAMSGFAWELIDLRRRVGLALLYPLTVFTLAYLLFLVFVFEFVERFRTAYDVFRLPVHGPLSLLLWLRETAAYWWWIPLALVLLFVIWWAATGSARLLSFTGPDRLTGLVPGMSGIARSYAHANFAELLAMLIEHGVPLSEAIVLAGDATGDRALRTSARTLAAAAEHGAALASSVPVSFPPFLRWLLIRGDAEKTLPHSLRLAADMYRRRAINQTEWMKFLFPILAGVIIGGGATLVYVLALFLPLIQLFRDLAV